MKKIYENLSRIQKELKAPKNLYNKFGNYHYRNAEGILEAVKPMLNGLTIVINDEPVMIGNRFYIKATVTLTDGEESVSAVAYAREDETKKGMDGCQITGACSSYARKYALNALLMIDDAKDSDDDSLSPKNPKNSGADIDLPKPEGTNNSFTRPNGQENVSATNVNKIPDNQENPVQKAFEEGMVVFMELYGITDNAEAQKRFCDYRKALQDGGVVPNGKKMQSVSEVGQVFDAIYKNFRPSGEKA